jgi:hypothetical protein
MYAKKRKPNPLGRYTIHSRHETCPKEKKIMRYISFDPGENHFDIRIEKRKINKYGDLIVKTISQERRSISYYRPLKRKNEIDYTISSSTISIIEALSSYSEYLGKIDIAIIERQMNICNNMMHMQSVIISFLLRFDNIFIAEISSFLKSSNFGLLKKMKRSDLKKWGETKAIDLAKKRGDDSFLEFLQTLKNNGLRINDSTDNYIQIEAFCIEIGYQCTN